MAWWISVEVLVGEIAWMVEVELILEAIVEWIPPKLILVVVDVLAEGGH